MRLAIANGGTFEESTPLIAVPGLENAQRQRHREQHSYSPEGEIVDMGLAASAVETFVLLNVERLTKLDRYFQQQVTNGAISAEASSIYSNAFSEIVAALNFGVGVPDALPGPDGQMMYHWKSGTSSIQVEVSENKDAEFYFFDKSTKADVFIEYKVGQFGEHLSATPEAKDLILSKQF